MKNRFIAMSMALLFATSITSSAVAEEAEERLTFDDLDLEELGYFGSYIWARNGSSDCDRESFIFTITYTISDIDRDLSSVQEEIEGLVEPTSNPRVFTFPENSSIELPRIQSFELRTTGVFDVTQNHSYTYHLARSSDHYIDFLTEITIPWSEFYSKKYGNFTGETSNPPALSLENITYTMPGESQQRIESRSKTLSFYDSFLTGYSKVWSEPIITQNGQSGVAYNFTIATEENRRHDVFEFKYRFVNLTMKSPSGDLHFDTSARKACLLPDGCSWIENPLYGYEGATWESYESLTPCQFGCLMQLNWMNDGGSFKPMPVCTEPFPERYYLSGSGLIVDEGNSADAEHMQFVSMMAFISLIGFIFMLDQNSASRDEDPANLYYEDI